MLEAEYVIHQDGRTFVASLQDGVIVAARETDDTDLALLSERASEAHSEPWDYQDVHEWLADEVAYGRARIISVYYEVLV